MNIGYISSDKYSPLLMTSICSLLENNRDVEIINFFILDDNISCENKERIKQLTNNYDRDVHFISNNIIENYAKSKGLTSFKKTYATYAKIFTDIAFEGIGRILIIDCDTIVNGSLEKVYSIDMKEAIVAAVPELTAKYHSSEDPSILSKKQFYYNTGFLLWNVEKCRSIKYSDVASDVMKQYGNKLRLADQSLLNMTLNDTDILPLSYIYNYNINIHVWNNTREKVQKEYETLGLGCGNTNYSKKISENEIVVIHYLGDKRPWIKGKHAPLSKPYKKYSRICGNTYYESYYDVIIANKIRSSPHSIFSNRFLGPIYAYYYSLKEYCTSKKW